jgi:hypothetical protein
MVFENCELVDATPEEMAAWEAYLPRQEAAEAITIPIPYAFPLGAVNIAGVIYLRDPAEDSYTEGAIIGVVNGTYKLDKSKTSATFYDPTGALVKVELKLEFTPGRLKGRICNRTFTGGWNCSGWTTLASW